MANDNKINLQGEGVLKENNTSMPIIPFDQQGYNFSNTQELAYIKGLLYTLVSRVGELEDGANTLKTENTENEANQATLDDNQAAGKYNDNEVEGSEESIDPTTYICTTHGEFNCDKASGEWQKGAFYYGCRTNASDAGWVEVTKGQLITFDAIARYSMLGTSIGNCSGYDSNCAAALFGLFYVAEMPDSWLDTVEDMQRTGRITPCTMESSGSSDQSSQSTAQDSSSSSSSEIKWTFTGTIIVSTGESFTPCIKYGPPYTPSQCDYSESYPSTHIWKYGQLGINPSGNEIGEINLFLFNDGPGYSLFTINTPSHKIPCDFISGCSGSVVLLRTDIDGGYSLPSIMTFNYQVVV